MASGTCLEECCFHVPESSGVESYPTPNLSSGESLTFVSVK